MSVPAYAVLGDDGRDRPNAPTAAEMAKMKRDDERRAVANLAKRVRIQPGYEGWNELGANLFGGPARAEGEYQKGLRESATTSNVPDDVRQRVVQRSRAALQRVDATAWPGQALARAGPDRVAGVF